MKRQMQTDIQTLIYKVSLDCWICGSNENMTRQHTPPKSLLPKHYLVIPVCRKCHNKINGIEYTGRQKQIIKSNIKKIEKASKNIREKML